MLAKENKRNLNEINIWTFVRSWHLNILRGEKLKVITSLIVNIYASVVHPYIPLSSTEKIRIYVESTLESLLKIST
jgi:hypothetical protein